MSRRLQKLTERIESLDARLATIEDEVRRLRNGDETRGEIDDVLRRCKDLVGMHVPAGVRLAVAAESEGALLALSDWQVTPFPRSFDHGFVAIAHLEAQRAQGTPFLLLPKPAASWMERSPEFAGHLLGRYEVVADEPGVGVLVDIGTRRANARPPRTLVEALDRLVDGARDAAVLDWTDLDLGSATDGRNAFVPPGRNGDVLPYLDHTIDVVLLADPSRIEEGLRVASGAVVVVERHEDGRIEVAWIEEVRADGAGAADAVLFVVASSPKDPWVKCVAEALAERPTVTVVASRDPWARAAAADTELVVLAERGVLPLPGCIEAASAVLTSDERVGGVAVKLLAADGSLEAAGHMVFADGSVEGVAGGCELMAAWHEYVRPVCAASGLLGVRSSAAGEASTPSGSLVGLSAALWEAGYEVRYQPDAWAVRALRPDCADGSAAKAAAEAWTRALPARPDRPSPLDVRAWRMLLAREDVEGCWR